jgi:two-component system NtrC family sensor kinase
MKFFIFLILLITGWNSISNGQNSGSDKLKYLAENAPRDTNLVKLLLDSSNEYSFTNTDTGLILAERALNLARELHFKRGEIEALNAYGETFHFLGDYPRALKIQFEALQISREMKDIQSEAQTLGFIGIVYNELGEYSQALQYLLPADKIYQQLPGMFQRSFVLSNIGDAYDFLKMRDSALYYQRMAYEKFSDPSRSHLKSFILRHMGFIYFEIGKNDSALKFYNESISNSRITNDKLNMSTTQSKVAELYESLHKYDSSLYYANAAFDNGRSMQAKLQMLQASSLLSKLHRETQSPDSAFFYLNIASNMKDSLYGPEKIRQMQLLMLEEQKREQTITQKAEQFKNKIKYTVLLSALGVFLLLVFILFKNNRQKQKANNLLGEQKSKIEETLTELKSTQSQLIQSEKMASLGELTAGIAHEIQNPLNFVNNFSDVNKELLVEMKGEMDNGNLTDAKDIANNIIANEEKINHHGKRADAIVKGMLQHSRSSTGQKEPTDINVLADEYLRLSYHGLRAKDKSFNATMKTDFDKTIGNINIIPQDIGRVLLNLYNNAFYAVTEKRRQSGNGYESTVTVSTKKINNKLEIRVKDSGNGIPQKVLDKIFQPFFTTKPTGQGTGLGLSLSYDIIKAHGGELKVETKEGEGAEFIIQLPS